MQVYAINKRAKVDYDILSTYEAGIQLKGYEVKSIRNHKIDLRGAYAVIRNGEVWVKNLKIPLYDKAGNIQNYDPTRERKLLLHKREIVYLNSKLQQRGLTIIVLKVYNSRNHIKVEIALAKGKKKYDKKQVLKERDIKRQIQRTLKYQA